MTRVNRSGLSKLQRTILDLAAEARRRRTDNDPEFHPDAHWYERDSKGTWNGIDIYSAQLLHKIWGFDGRWPGTQVKLRLGRQHVACGHIFDPDAIGRAKYNAAKSALSRAIQRLQQRGLVTVYVGVNSRWTGITLV